MGASLAPAFCSVVAELGAPFRGAGCLVTRTEVPSEGRGLSPAFQEPGCTWGGHPPLSAARGPSGLGPPRGARLSHVHEGPSGLEVDRKLGGWFPTLPYASEGGSYTRILRSSQTREHLAAPRFISVPLQMILIFSWSIGQFKFSISSGVSPGIIYIF